MKLYEIFVVIVLAILLVWVIKVLLKLTSLMIKILVWFCLVVLAVYVLNYYILPRVGWTPLPINEFISKELAENKVNEKLVYQFEKTKNNLKPKLKEFIDKKLSEEK